jgi:hypothetical protein
MITSGKLTFPAPAADWGRIGSSVIFAGNGRVIGNCMHGVSLEEPCAACAQIPAFDPACFTLELD